MENPFADDFFDDPTPVVVEKPLIEAYTACQREARWFMSSATAQCDIEVLMSRAQQLYLDEDYEGALAAASEWLLQCKTESSRRDATDMVARCLSRASAAYARAVEVAQRLTHIYQSLTPPSGAFSWALLGDIHAKEEQWALADEAYKRACASDPMTVQWWCRLARVYVCTGKHLLALYACQIGRIALLGGRGKYDRAVALRRGHSEQLSDDEKRIFGMAPPAETTTPLFQLSHARLQSRLDSIERDALGAESDDPRSAIRSRLDQESVPTLLELHNGVSEVLECLDDFERVFFKL